MSERIKLVVIDEHALGYVNLNEKYAHILHSSPLRGTTFSQFETVLLEGRTVRLASECDFKVYNCSFEGYNRTEYEYVENSNCILDPQNKQPMKILINIEGGVIQYIELENPNKEPLTIGVMDIDPHSEEETSISVPNIITVQSIIADNREHTSELQSMGF